MQLLISQYETEIVKEREEKERAQQLSRELTQQLKKKDRELKKLHYFMEAASLSLMLSSKALDELKVKS